MIEHIPEMVEAGIDSFKIEGRMKTALYVATVARTYRKAIAGSRIKGTGDSQLWGEGSGIPLQYVPGG